MAWYHPGFMYKKALVIPHTNINGGSDLSDFPLLVSISSPDLATTMYGGMLCSPLGFDFLFTNGAETRELAYEIDQYVASTGTLISWVRVPLLSVSRDTTLYLYFGNPTITASLATPQSVWDAYSSSVWHLGNGVSLNAIADSVSANAPTTCTASAISGQINGGASCNGAQTIQTLNTGGLDMSIGDTITLSAWAKRSVTGTVSWQSLIEHGSGTQRDYELAFAGSSLLTIAQDTFAGRTVSGGWGTGSDGNVWNLQPGATGTLAVSSGEGSASSTSGVCQFSYGSATATNVDMLVRFSLGSTSDTVTLEGRASYSGSTTTSYRLAITGSTTLSLQCDMAGSVTILTQSSVSLSPGTFYWMRFQINGSTLSGHYWQDGTAEPTTWLSTTDTTIPGPGQYGLLVTPAIGTDKVDHFQVRIPTTTDSLAFLYRDSSDTTWQCYASLTPLIDTNWHHYALSYVYGTPSSATLFVDGSAVNALWIGGTGAVSPITVTDNLAIGSTSDTADSFNGFLDEVHISKGIARSAGWIATEYNNQLAPLSFLRVGETIPFSGNRDVPLICSYGNIGVQSSNLQVNEDAQGVLLIVAPLTLASDDSLTILLFEVDETSGQNEIVATFTCTYTGHLSMFVVYPGLAGSSSVVSASLPRSWFAVAASITGEPASYTVSASLIV